MPSSAPTVSKAAGRVVQGRPEAREIEGPGLLPAARAVEASDDGRRHPGGVSARPPPLKRAPAAESADQEPSPRPVFPVCRPVLASQACGPGVRPLPPCDPSPRWASRRLFRPAGCLGSPALPTAIWECRGGGNMAPSRDNARENLGSTSRRGREPG